MKADYKLFCDESNHLYSDKSDIMVLGGIGCPSSQVEYANRYIKYLKHKHNAKGELKWTKLNSNKKEFYKDILEFFFSNRFFRFNAQVILNKSKLNHDEYNESDSNLFYYKMYYYAIMPFLQIDKKINIFMDYKDTRGGQRVRKLKEVVNNTFYGQIDCEFTIIQSYESQIMQLADILIGAIGYKNREDIEHKSKIKNYIVSTIEKISGINLNKSTPPWENKFRIYLFYPKDF